MHPAFFSGGSLVAHSKLPSTSYSLYNKWDNSVDSYRIVFHLPFRLRFVNKARLLSWHMTLFMREICYMWFFEVRLPHVLLLDAWNKTGILLRFQSSLIWSLSSELRLSFAVPNFYHSVKTWYCLSWVSGFYSSLLYFVRIVLSFCTHCDRVCGSQT